MLTESALRGRKPGVYSDKGGAPGLMLRIEVVEKRDRKTGKVRTVVRRRFFARLTIKGGKRRDIGLGPAGDGAGQMSLTAARETARQYRELARLGVDPAEARNAAIEAEAKARAEAAAKAVTFREVCEEYLAAHAGSWRNPKARQQWENTLRGTYDVATNGGAFGDLPVATITTEHVLAVLKPLWTTTTETGSRLRGRLERVLASAIAQGFRGHPNPAAWRDNLAALLPAARRIAPVVHHKALAYAELPTFMAALADMPGMGAKPRKYAASTRGRPFAKGNPGKPKGARHKTTLAVEALMQGEAETIGRKAVELAKGGDLTAIKLVLDRIAPARKDAPVTFDLPKIEGVSDLSGALAAIMAAVGDGTLSPGEGQALAAMVETVRRSYETADLAERVAALEEREEKSDA
jgi:hypothetical protein